MGGGRSCEAWGWCRGGQAQTWGSNLAAVGGIDNWGAVGTGHSDKSAKVMLAE